MLRRAFAVVIALCLLIAPAAQAEAHPTIAVLTFGTLPDSDANIVQTALFAVLQANGFINDEERKGLAAGMEVENDAIAILRGDAGFDFANANTLVESLLDEGASALVTVSTPMTLAALNVTQDMDEPPAILFAQAVNPYAAGIAESACEKSANITGVEAMIDYGEILGVMKTQDPDLAIIGTLHNSNEISGRLGADAIAGAAQAVGIAVKAAAVTNVSELPAATEGLISKGVEALFVPWDVTTTSGLPIIAAISQDNAIPLIYASSFGAMMGATIGAGQAQHMQQGLNLGHILVAFLNGGLDIADTAISSLGGSGISVNLTIPSIPIAPEVASMAEFSLTEKGRVTNPRQFFKRIGQVGVTQQQVMQVLAEAAGESGASRESVDDVASLLGHILVAATESETGKAVAEAFLETLSCASM